MREQVDVLILGSGFSGSLLSLLLVRRGLRVAVIDRGVHPRFAIGESSTPLADATLADLAEQYDLPELLPLTAFGSWRQKNPELMCGLKRGFSYFGHTADCESVEDKQLLVAASSNDEHADTHWLRSDVDAWLFDRAADRGVQQFESARYELTQEDLRWQAVGNATSGQFAIDSPMIVDATGAAGQVLRHLKIPTHTHQLRTNTWAVYGHFANVLSVGGLLDQAGTDRRRHPFDCDAAAVHHVLADSWMWQLRFSDQRVSAGLVIDGGQRSTDSTADQVWRNYLQRYPLLQRQFAAAQCIAPSNGLQITGRLQRLSSRAAGTNWAALPNTAGFIDPLHSTGIAHSMFGVRRLAKILMADSLERSRASELENYSHRVLDELRFVDSLVEGCYAALPSFRLWSAWCMLYFAAATSMEQAVTGNDVSFLGASDVGFRTLIDDARVHLQTAIEAGRTEHACKRFEDDLRTAIAPWNHVGLLDRRCDGMYAKTAKPIRG